MIYMIYGEKNAIKCFHIMFSISFHFPRFSKKILDQPAAPQRPGDWIVAPSPTRRASPGKDTPQPGRDTWVFLKKAKYH